jgi:hypothetical protein
VSTRFSSYLRTLFTIQLIGATRELLMHYLSDLGQTGVNECKCLRLLWPALGRSLLRLDRDLPKWTTMLQDGTATCCFAVAVNDCLEYNGDVSRLCEHSKTRRMSKATPSRGPLFSTSISLHENPSVVLPLAPAGILTLNAGRLVIMSEYREGCAQLAEFSIPDALHKLSALINGSSLDSRQKRFGPRTHTEFLDLMRDTGLSVNVCIMDR